MDDSENNRDEQLINEREEYENSFIDDIIDEMIKSDALDKLIADRFEYIDNHFDFEPSPEYEQLEEIYLQQYDSMETSYDVDGFQEYVSNDDPFDSLDGCDYPDGPDENIEGIKFTGQYYQIDENDFDELPNYEFDESDFDEFANYEYDEPEIDLPDFEEQDYAKIYDELVQEADFSPYENDDIDFKNLIENHIQDEKEFLDSIITDVIQEQSYFEKAIDEILFEHIEEEYLPEDFDYEPDYWYDDSFDYYTDEVWPEDESIIDPFDSLGDIDYPDFEPKTDYYEIPEFDDDVDDRFIELQLLKMEKEKEDSIRVPEEVIPEPPEDDEIVEFIDENELSNQELIKNYVDSIKEAADNILIKEDALDKIIKEKLKEKKFKNN